MSSSPEIYASKMLRMAQEKIKNRQKNAVIDALGQELALLKLERISQRGGHN